MSAIAFKCEEKRKEEVKQKFLEILCEHYYNTVAPNTNVKYEDEGKDVYMQRIRDMMDGFLCKAENTKDGVRVEFDSTEDAGFEIAMGVYGTGMGYSDNGLTFLKPLFDELINQMPDVCFEAQCECFDNWAAEEYTCSYDGENFECDAEWMDEEEWED